MPNKSFGERLKKNREERFLSQHQLAEAIEIEPAQISRYERGLVMPNAESLLALSRVVRVGVGTLLGQDEQPSGQGHPTWIGSRQVEEIVSRCFPRSARG